MNLLQKTAHALGQLKAAYDAPLLQKALSLQVDSIGRALPMQFTGGSFNWLQGAWHEKMRGQVWRVANFYATTGAQVPLALYKSGNKGKAEKVLKHPVLDLLYQPNPDQGAFMFFYAVLMQLRSCGNCFISTVVPDFGSKKNAISELWILPVLNVQPLIDGKVISAVTLRPVEAYRYTPDLSKPGEYQDLDRKQVLHLKQYNPDGGVWGLGCIVAAEKEITGDDASIRTQVALLQNQGPKGVLYFEPVDNRPPELGLTVVPDLRRRLGRMFSVPESAGQFPILTQKVGWTATGISAVDMQILEFRRANFADLCGYYGVPSILLNDKEGTTYANLEAARKMLYSQAILPVLNYLASELTRWLVAQFDATMWLEPDTSKVPELQEDIAALVGWLKDAYWIKTSRKQELCGETPDAVLPEYLVPATLVDLLAPPTEPVADTVPGMNDTLN